MQGGLEGIVEYYSFIIKIYFCMKSAIGLIQYRPAVDTFEKAKNLNIFPILCTEFVKRGGKYPRGNANQRNAVFPFPIAEIF